MDTPKKVHTVILDAGPIIKNEPAVSTLLAQSEQLVTVPSIISEIRDQAARTRIETTLLPFLTLRHPKPESIKFIQDFSRRTGDLAVLSKPDIYILALAYEIECERNEGDWRLRRVPGQKRVNGSPPVKKTEGEQPAAEGDQKAEASEQACTASESASAQQEPQNDETKEKPESEQTPSNLAADTKTATTEQITQGLSDTHISSEAQNEPKSIPEKPAEEKSAAKQEVEADSGSESDGGWITPSNIKKRQAKDAETAVASGPEPKTMQVATITSDFAMQNVLLQVNLNLLSPSLQRVKQVKTYVLRCHACFQICKDMSKQFCPRCGKPTLTRVSCTTNQQTGEFKLHLKKNMQWNTRGEKYSIPKPVAGSANGKITSGGGKGGWGQSLLLAEDQKEYITAKTTQERQARRERNLMDDDFLPGILTGERASSGGRIRVGAGRNVNSRKR
ncbi:putative 20S-pre-rRNA D-site endonuclease nob1 [Xylona heveae TC161]|uniref:20S-pre-rRNA D-site endonuclease NOB1 n=1 Tax=Xylona heveae (strain CBS 132557 / TC161) TaxID=1328760 RepID=A0A165AF94_XYLHT|nr:putative 20S-pre-rRNA D-site endonuclease nob1 [Xylona heveae TC161]KZF20380.1 putative 20S-pre-rRNA D-site endonuclease nob1 [Xylona heveae TC161]